MYGELFEYNNWATNRLLNSIAAVTHDVFVKQIAGEFSSLQQQCAHLVVVVDRYRSRLMNEPVPDPDLFSFQSVAEVLEYQKGLEDRIAKLIPTLTSERLKDEIRNETKRGLFIATVEQVLIQMINHSTYHRGQIAAFCKVLGLDYEDTDYVIWVKTQAQ